jgi:hypothetical protein
VDWCTIDEKLLHHPRAHRWRRAASILVPPASLLQLSTERLGFARERIRLVSAAAPLRGHGEKAMKFRWNWGEFFPALISFGMSFAIIGLAAHFIFHWGQLDYWVSAWLGFSASRGLQYKWKDGPWR